MTDGAKDSDFFRPARFSLLLALALGAMYFPVLFGGESFFYRDFGVLGLPTATFHKNAVLSGEMPFWNPYSNCGAPFLAQWGTMVLYPLTLIYVLLPMPWSLNFFCIVHLWLAGMGMYFLAKRWCDRTWPAALAGFAFTFNGITQAALAWPNYVAALALLPWVLLTNERAWNPDKVPPLFFSRERRSTSGAIITASLISTLQLLTGVPELGLLTWLVVGSCFLAEVFSNRHEAPIMVRRFAFIIVATAGLLCIQLLPFYELLENSQRTRGSSVESWSLTFAGLANLVLPRFRTLVTPEGTAFQYDQAFLSSVYLGAPLLILAAVSLRIKGRARLLGVLTCASLLLALGSKGLLYPLLVSIFPPLGVARFPVKFLFVLAFTTPLLAAWGAAHLETLPKLKVRKQLLMAAVAVTFVFSVLITFNFRSPLQYDRLNEFLNNSIVRIIFVLFMLGSLYFTLLPGRGAAIAGIAFLFLYACDSKFHLRLNPTISSSIFQGNTWAQAQKVEKPGLGTGRIFISPSAEARLLHSEVGEPEKDLLGKRMAEWSHLNLLDAVPKVNGSSTLQVREQALLQNSLYSGTNKQLDAWLDFLGVHYRTASNSVVAWEATPQYSPIVTAGQAPIFDALSPLEHPIQFDSQAAIHSKVANSERIGSATVAITNLSVQLNQISFDANASGPSLAIIAQTWFPSWKAEITSGEGTFESALLRANLAFQAVVLPAGPSHARIYYDDHSFKLGAAVSGATLLFCALIWVREKKSTLPN